ETEVILQQLLEDVYNQKFQDIIQTQIMIPAEMNNSSIAVLLDEKAAQRAALGFDQENNVIPGGWKIYPESASAGLWTTAEDFAKMIQQLLMAYQGGKDQLLSPEMAQQALAKVHNDKAMLYNNWGPEATFGYGGAPMGYYVTFESNPEQGWAVVILCNKFLQWRFVNELKAGLKSKFELDK
ncbi:MAG: serine hydrolase domain-containing protein, partial [Bacteroidota bacterium]